ncbi:L-fuculose-phosphate aldolase [Aliiruegeria haliotis]|uniref:L-fuculose-phosphate aldolase n=1 Tax=Aliiruegeria haliotis TaxID=1280846 RepID=A0A2T0RIG8_9RHOB|nr:class II aldolase/adducin family protein [Aliiruegeria haliotis]PRY20975.1 L-fuculose-phosphate aldolase [Aliiruegeria haliotis]
MAGWGYIETETLSEPLLDAFQRNGGALFQGGLNNSHSGNLSVRGPGGYWVTRTRSMGHITRKDDVIWATEDGSGDTSQLSREFMVHKAIYEASDHRAVVHCHPCAANSLALIEDVILPLQIEGHGALPSHVPVLEVANASASQELCDALAPMLADVPAVLVRGHGLFVGADSLDQATHRAFVVNDAARMILDMRMLGADLGALRNKPYLAAGYGAAPVAAAG